MNELYQQLKQFGDVKINVPMSKRTTFRVGGMAQMLVKVDKTNQLVALLNFLSENGVEFFVLGGGSNLLWPDAEYEGVVVEVKTTGIKIDGNVLEVAAGVPLALVVNTASQNSLSGMEWAIGIPGTVGGAVRGNAGAMGKDIGLAVEKVEVWQNGEVVEIPSADCTFGYRSSVFKSSGGVVLRTWLRLVPSDKLVIATEMKKFLDQRTGRYPASPSAGSFFKNLDITAWPGDPKELPPLFIERKKIPVGWLVEQCALKGFTVGGAKVSDEHGNFIVNADSATQADVLAVVEEVKTRVYNKFKVELEPEVEIVK